MDQVWTNVPDDHTTYPKISVTELRDLLRCTKKHDYAYRQGLRPATSPSYFGKGRYLHGLEEARLTSYAQGTPLTTVSEIGNAALADMRRQRDDGDPSATVGEPDRVEINGIYADYLGQVDMTNVEVLGVEREFFADVGLTNTQGRPVLLHGFLDALISVNGLVWLIEHKTAGRAWSQGQFVFDYQSRLYTSAVEALGKPRPAGTAFNFFYPKRWETKLVYVTPEESQLLLNEVQEAIWFRDAAYLVRQPHWGCNDCGFRTLCHAELSGGDSEYTRKTEFTVDQDKVDRFAEEA